jgi:hypothetical protein
MDAIFCNDCGARLDEAPTLLPAQRPPCPSCGSLARRFEITVGTEARASIQAHAQVAQGVGEAFDATVRTEPGEARSGAAMVQARIETRSSGVRGPRRIIDHLVVQGRSLWWTQLTEEGGWMLQVVDEAGEEIATGVWYDPVEALAAVAEFILPGHPG